MAQNVIAQVLGGRKKVLDGVSTVSDVRREMSLGANYTASIDGEAARDADAVSEGQFVSFSESVKGA